MDSKWVKISDLLFFQEGPGVRNTQYTSSGVKLLNVANLVGGEVNLSTSNRFISEEEAFGKYKHFLCDEGDFVVASSGIKVDYLDKKMGFIRKEMLPLCMNTSTIRFKAINKDRLNIRYFMYYVKSQHFKDQVAFHITGSAQLNYGPSHLKKMIMPLVSIDRQEEIVEHLDKVSNLILMRQQEISKLDELVKARFVELFGDPVLNEKGWETRPFLDMGNCKNGMNFHYEDSGVELNCLGVGDFKDYAVITNTELLPTVSLNEMPSEEYLLRDDDIVFVRSNGNKALVGRSVAVYPGDTPTTFSGFCIRYRKHDDSITIPYLLRVLKTDSIRKKMAGRGANIQNLNQQILGTLIIPVPPLDLQNQFAEFVKQVDKSKLLKNNYRKDNNIKTIIQQNIAIANTALHK